METVSCMTKININSKMKKRKNCNFSTFHDMLLSVLETGKKKQRNFCVNHLRKTNKQYFNNSNIKTLSDGRNSGLISNHFFSDKGLNSSAIMLAKWCNY